MEVLTAHQPFEVPNSWTCGEAQQWQSADRAFLQAALQEATMALSHNSGRATSNATSAPFVELRQSLASRAVPDPTEPQGLLLTHGRGLHLMRTLMDEVSFEERGTVVRMRKRMKTR